MPGAGLGETRDSQVDHTVARGSDQVVSVTDSNFHIGTILGSISDAVITTDPQGMVQYLNPVATKLTGWNLDAALGRPVQQVFNVVDADTWAPLGDLLQGCLQQGGTAGCRRELVLLHRDGITTAIEQSVQPIRDPQGKLAGGVLVFRDVSHSRKLAAQVDWQTSHDPLTGLMNRVGFDLKLEELLRSARDESREHCLMYMDLDQFKIVNDTCGHFAGDELLRQVTDLLSKQVRGNDILARLGGDEFGVLLVDCPQQPALRIADEMRQSVREFRFPWNEQRYAIGVSIGLVSITGESESVERMLSAADTACYAAKEGGRNQVHLYRSDEGEAALRHGEMHWVSRIHQALVDDRFRLFVQPIIPTDSAGMRHHEVLVRMLDGEGDLIMPGAFIPAAERFNLMPEIDRWVVSRVFALIAAHRDRLVDGGYHFAINLSGSSVSDRESLDFIVRMLAEYRVPGEMISFEITETAAIANLSSASNFIRTLKQSGCSFSLDDFGSGLSSFAYLKNLPVDFLKIDGTFVKDMVEDPIDLAMVEAINQIGHVMKLETIAEFVESDAIFQHLCRIGVDYAQGFGVARPVPLADGDGRLLLDESPA